jgi:translation initiation factor 1A
MQGRGGKNRKKGRHADAAQPTGVEFANADGGQTYAVVLSSLGDGRFSVICNDGARRMAILRGCMRRRVWVRRGDLLTVSTRDFQDDKVDVLHRHCSDDVNTLTLFKELSDALVSAYTCEPGGEEEDKPTNSLVFSTDDGIDVDAI